MQDILVPDIGDFHDVEVIEVLVAAGQTIAVDTPLITLETEKATIDVPSTAAGVIKELKVKKGDRVSKGTPLVSVEAGPETKPAPAPAQPATPAPAPAKQSTPTPVPAAQEPVRPSIAPPSAVAPTLPSFAPIDEAGFARAYASPSVRRFARELGVDLARVRGTGLKGRITPEDVKAWVKQALVAPAQGKSAVGAALPQLPEIDFSKFGEVEVKPLGRVQKISGPRLHASWVNVPHVWQMDQADITDLEDVRTKLKGKAAKEGIKLTPLAFILRACVKALQEFPTFNASLDPTGQNLVYKKYMHMAFAADTPQGLLVPVIRDINRKDVYEIARDLGVLSEKARDGKLGAADMQGACFTVSSLGGIGGTAFTPIINAPEVAILGVSRSSMQPVFQNGSFVPRLMLPFSLAYDHRVIDGALAARFTTFLAAKLADVRSLLEAVP
jgi:pyruvate dehydrogenase E2 component (dihydrolipoamide acetyltransferase)